MIFDCFTFFNELDLLEIRLHELDKVVDKFVLVEATRTFQKQPKPLYFQENKKRFEPFLDKIIHIVVDKYPTFWTKLRPVKTWDYENRQREYMFEALKDCKPTDQIIISDIDEIPRWYQLQKAAELNGVKVFELEYYCYYLNYQCIHYQIDENASKKVVAQGTKNGKGFWRGTVMLDYQYLKNKVKTIKKTRLLRDKEGDLIHVIENGGWHFSFLGGIEKVLEKLKAYSHKEFNNENFVDIERIEKTIREGKDLYDIGNRYHTIPVDDSFPLVVQKNPQQYAHLIKSL